MPSLEIKRTISAVQTDISSSIEWPTVQFDLVLTKEISKLRFSILNTPGKVVPNLGDQIDAYQNGVHIFGGTVTEKNVVVAGGVLPEIQYTVMDWSFKLDTKLVVKTYSQMDPQDIIEDIIQNYTDGSYTTANVQKGNFLIRSVKFNYEPVTKAIQKVASLIGWDWYVDPDKDVHFFLSQHIPAPFDIDDANGNQEWPSIDIDQDLTNMKNSVFVIGALYKKSFSVSTTPDIYKTDGTASVYSLAFSYENDNALTVTLDGIVQTVGIENQVTDPLTVQVLYNPANRYVRFTSVPASGKTVKVYGNAKIPIVAHAKDGGAIATYGEIQSSIVDKQITTVGEAQTRAEAEILQYGHAIYVVKFNTIQPGLVVGQTILLNSTKLGFTNIPLVIKRITGNGYSPSNMRWQVECFGSDQVTFVDLISTLLKQQNNENNVDDTTILQLLITTVEELLIADTISITAGTSPYLWGVATPEARWDFARYA